MRLSENHAYPNPFNNLMEVAIKNHNGETITMLLRNQKGELLQTRQVRVANDKVDFQIGSAKIPDGIYTLSLHIAGEVVTLRVVKQL